MYDQKTTRRKVALSGRGLHTGHPVNLSILPSFPGSGIVFARVDQESWARFLRHTRDGGVLLPTRASSVAFLSHAHGVKDVELIISTMEAALRRMQKEDEA